MAHIELNIKDARLFLSEQPEFYQQKIKEIHETMHAKTSKGHDFLGWLNWPIEDRQDEWKNILEAAEQIRKQSQVLVVIGIGGSYLGAKAGLEFLKEPFQKEALEILFAGHHMSGHYMANLLTYLKDKDFSINVISKSGTTTEPAIAFRILKDLLEQKYGIEQAKKRIYATTDKRRGALYTMAKANQYVTFEIPDDVGGRYSVLTAVGLLPMAAAGIDVFSMMQGAKDAYWRYLDPQLETNESYLYAATRHLLYQSGKKIEMLVGYEPNLMFLNEWWKQLFGESEGKENKGLFVASASFSTDLHSLGQYIQEGERHLFETVIDVKKPVNDVLIPETASDLDELNYLKGKPLSYVNQQALKGTMMAHKEGNVPNLLISIPTFDAYTFGYLVYFFEKACAVSAYLMDINPFDQPGVEAYKKNMFALLGKKGYEDVLK